MFARKHRARSRQEMSFNTKVRQILSTSYIFVGKGDEF